MLETVPFPTVFSDRAKTMPDCIAGIPQVREVVLLHAVREIRPLVGGQGAGTPATEEAKTALAEAKEYVPSLTPCTEVTPETLVAPDVADTILSAALNHDAPLSSSARSR